MVTGEESVAEFVAAFPAADIPADVNAIASEAILDCVGVLLAGSTQAPARKVQEQIRPWSGQGLSVLGTDLRVAPMEAALANGTAAHALDFDDMGAFGHPSAVLVPAILAAGELVDATGTEALAAYAIGFEVGVALNRGLGISRGESGLHTTGMIGVFAAAAAAARLLKLDTEQVRMAMGVAASTPAGLVQNFGTHTKSLHAGMAARNAVMAVQLASTGFTSNPRFIEGAGGMLHVYGRGDVNRLRAALGGLGTTWLMPETLTIKRFPCCGSTHGAITAIQAILAEQPVALDEVEWLEVAELPPASHVLLYPNPVTGFQGKFSIEYAAAKALTDGGRVNIDTFADDGTQGPEYLEARSKVRVVVGSKWQHGGDASFEDTTVTIRLKDGRELRKTIDRFAMPGTRHAPLHHEKVREKFAANCERAGFNADDLYRHWAQLGEQARIRDGIVAATGQPSAAVGTGG